MAGFGAINGTVRDSSGAVIIRAIVTLSNASTGLQRDLVTNESGYFVIPSLPPGPGYQVSVSMQGFELYETKGLQLEVGQTITLSIVLRVAGQKETVVVSDASPIVDQVKVGVSQVVDNTQIQNLPINGRRVDTFVLLTPGVTADGSDGRISFRGVPAGNSFLQDGNDVTQQFYNENAGRGRISSNISQDAIQEFQVQTSGYTAEFGRAVGGVINTVSKSGTNDIHGTAYWYFRNQNLNARDRYASRNPTESRHQTGFSIGGPVIKNRLLYFFNGEIMRRDFPIISSILNPQFFDAGGNWIGTCGAPATTQQCTNAVNYFRRFFGTVDRSASQNSLFGKLDWRPNNRNSISMNFNLLDWNSPNGVQTAAVTTNAGAFGYNGNATVKDRWARISYTAIFSPSQVNEFRFGWFRDLQLDDTNPELAPLNGLLSGLTVQGQSNLGMPSFLPRVQPNEHRFQVADNFSWSVGRHQIKFGFDISDTQDTEEALYNGPGSYTYATISDFARDLTNLDNGQRWQSYVQAFGPTRTEVFAHDYNIYAQDQWRVTDALTLNYGLRFETARFAQPKVANPDYPGTGHINEPKANFAPRLGIAYAFNHGKTVLRTGYGLFYARLPAATIARLHQLNGVVQKSITLQGANAADKALGPIFPTRLLSLDRVPAAGTVDVKFASPDLATPYTVQGDLTLEHEITNDMGISISYLMNRGIKLITRQDLNIGRPTGTFTYRINDAAGNQVGTYTTATYLRANRVDPRYSRVVYADNGGRLWYDGMAVQFRRRVSRWISGTAAYTWSHSIDLSQGGHGSNLFPTDTPSTVANGDYSAERGNSALDLRHRFVGSAIATPPNCEYGSRFVDLLLNGWQLSVITTAASAEYTTPTVLVSGSQFTGMAFTNTLNGFGGGTRVPFLPRASIPIDSTFLTDARISKMIKIRERYQLQFHFETFNTFNHVKNTAVTAQAYTATAGVLKPTTGLGTGTASGGFPDGTNARRAQLSIRLIF